MFRSASLSEEVVQARVPYYLSLRLLFLAEFLESGIGAQRVPDLTRLLVVRPDLLRAREELLEIRTVTDRIPNRVNLQKSYGN